MTGLAVDGADSSDVPHQRPVAVDYRVAPETYRHWRVTIEDQVATLSMDVDEGGGLVAGYELKLNSYDLGVDIELYDAIQRLRFGHPEVRVVVLTSGNDKVFCAGANIRMLAASSHAWKVNFCKFTNETRNGIEDASANSGQIYLAALNGTAAGGGYELALACEHIMLVDDRKSTVSLPELPLLGVLPGTGGLTRVVDKRRVRRDLADYFSTKAEGVGGQTAVRWHLVDEIVPKTQWSTAVAARAAQFAEQSGRQSAPHGIELPRLEKERSGEGINYGYVSARFDRPAGLVEITIAGPSANPPVDVDHLHSAGAEFWSLQVTRELDDLILDLRTNETGLGTWVFRSVGDPERVLAYDQFLLDNAEDWLVNEIILYLKRTLKRLDVTSRSLLALIEPGSCFAGSILELALAADRSFQLLGTVEADGPNAQRATIALGGMNFGPLPMGNGLTRLQTRFLGDDAVCAALEKRQWSPIEADEASELGLVTFTPDDIDWADEIRITVEERRSFNPDALSGLEANYRFAGPETIESKIFGRLSAWQNWIFYRPNASGPRGALRQYGTGQRPEFDQERV